MATDLEKSKNLGQFSAEMVISLASGTHNLLGNASLALAQPVGEQILRSFEKKNGLEIAGENPKDIIMEIIRIFVDELGFAGNIDVKEYLESQYQILVENCFLRHLTDEYLEITNSKTPNSFICPIQNSIKAAFARNGFKMISRREPLADHGSIISIELI